MAIQTKYRLSQDLSNKVSQNYLGVYKEIDGLKYLPGKFENGLCEI